MGRKAVSRNATAQQPAHAGGGVEPECPPLAWPVCCSVLFDAVNYTNPYLTSNPRKNQGQDGHSSSVGHRDSSAYRMIRSMW
jgi:hypothetical protein